MAKIEIVDTSFNRHNKISYIKNLMLPKILYQHVSLTWNFQSSFDELCPSLPDSFSLSVSVYMHL